MRAPKPILIILAAAVIGGGAGAYFALGTLPGNGSGEKGRPAQAGGESSYYFSHLWRGGLDVKEMTPLMVSARPNEQALPDCPERLAIVGKEGGYAESVLPFLEAVEPPAMRGGAGLAKTVLGEMRSRWETLRSIAHRPLGDPPLRILVKHYPRPDLAGRCVSIQVTFYDVPDMYFDRAALLADPESPPVQGKRIRGAILDLYRTYQLSGNQPRLIQALAEVSAPVLLLPQRLPITQILRRPDDVSPGSIDGVFASHFLAYGGGVRQGLLWIDRSNGIGKPAAFSTAYRVVRRRMRQSPSIETGAIPASLVAALKDWVSRA